MRRRRSGTTLVEVVAAMGANAILAGIAVVALASLGRADRDVNSRLDERAALTNFAEQLRLDIHAAETIRWDEQRKVLHLGKSPGDAIEFRADKSRWSRYLSGSDDAEPELASAFRLPRSLAIAFDPVEASAGEIIRVRLRSPISPSKGGGPSRDEELVIVVGRDARLLNE